MEVRSPLRSMAAAVSLWAVFVTLMMIKLTAKQPMRVRDACCESFEEMKMPTEKPVPNPVPSNSNWSFPKAESESIILMNNRYVLSESYWEELTMATRNFMGLVRIASSWGARAVLPFTAGSRIYGINVKYTLDRIYDLDDIKRVYNLPMPVIMKFKEFLSIANAQYTLDLIYDLDDIKRVCNIYSLPMPVRFEEFLSNASRSVVLMVVDYSGVSGNHTERCSDQQRRNAMLGLDHLNTVTNEKGLQIFEEVGCCVVYSHHPTTPTEIAKGCQILDGDFTVLIKTWQGITQDYSKIYRLVIDKRENVTITSDFKHSKWVIGNATRLFYDVTKSDECVAIHVRAEKLLPHKVDRCLKLLNEVLTKFKSKHPNFQVLYFGDKQLDHFRNRINNANVTRFNGAKYGAVTDRGFAAQVEQHTASLCKALIVSGGGSFQGRTVRRFNEFPEHLPHLAACERR